jgi:hypothetical protein
MCKRCRWASYWRLLLLIQQLWKIRQGISKTINGSISNTVWDFLNYLSLARVVQPEIFDEFIIKL